MTRPVLDRRRAEGEREAFDQWCDDLKVRLKNVCGDMAAGELDLLAARMTRLRLKYRFTTGLPNRV